LHRMVRGPCQLFGSLPLDSTMESLSASLAVGISLYELSVQRAGGRCPPRRPRPG
ncbi:23S rRNA (guanosine(2251)-2'-O)-methyltransferase RlmB, partial [Micrococcus sp. SIMBA_131]